MRVSTSYHKNGQLLLGTFPGMATMKYVVKDIHLVPTLGLTMEVDKPLKKPDLLTHLALHTATAAIGYVTKGSNVRAVYAADWFTPEVLRAARVFLKEVSTAQYTNTGATAVQRPGFLYYPSELGIVDVDNGVRWNTRGDIATSDFLYLIHCYRESCPILDCSLHVNND